MKYLSKQSLSGYSLIELIVVLVLIGLITAIATPFLMTTIGKTKLKTSAKEIATTFRYARSRAIATKNPFYFYLDLNRSAYWISPENINKDKKGNFNYEDVLKTATKIRTISKEIIIQKVSVGTSTKDEGIIKIPFYPQGNTINAKIYLKQKNESNSAKHYEILLDEITGRVKITKSNNSEESGTDE